MPAPPAKMSIIMQDMAEQLLCQPDATHSSEAAHVALMFANIAWNKAIGTGQAVENYRSAWEDIEAENPELWSEFKTTDINAMVEQLESYKKKYYSDDFRRIILCGIPNGNIRVEWLAPAKPGVDSQAEMQLFALIRTGQEDQAIAFLRDTQGLSRTEAKKQVKQIKSNSGLV